MKNLVAIFLIFMALYGLSACQVNSTPVPATAGPAVTLTPIPSAPSATATITPIPPLNSPNGPPLKSIHMFNGNDGWGVIYDSLLITHNGGVNWFSVPLSEGKIDDATETFFQDALSAYVVIPMDNGQSARLLSTSNGGGTWQISTVPFLRGILTFTDGVGHFLQPTSASANLMEVSLFASNDNGLTWTQLIPRAQQGSIAPISSEGIKTGMSFINIDHGWIGIATQPQKVVLYRTTNSGLDWTPQEVPVPQNISSLVASSLPPEFFKGDGTNGFLPVDFVSTESSDQNRVFYNTNDGGETWSPGGSIIDGGAYNFIDPKTGWVWGKRGLYFTNDGAQTWQPLPVAFGSSEHATDINFVDKNNGWILTSDAKNRVRIYRSQDGGNTWLAVNP